MSDIDELKDLEKNEEVDATNTLTKILKRFNLDDESILVNSPESSLFIILYCLISDNHVYNFDHESNLLKGKRLDLQLASEICKQYLLNKNIPLPLIKNFIWDSEEYKIINKEGYFKNLVYQPLIRKKGENNADKNLQIKKNNFWIAYKAYKQGNKTGFRDAKKWAYDIIKDRFYDKKSAYHEFYKKFAWLYQKDKK